MYKSIIRPLLFRLQPETVHHLIVVLVKLGFKIPGVKQLVKAAYSFNKPELHREFLGLKFKSPVGLAAGFDKNAEFYSEFSSFGFSFIEIGTVTPKAQAGNPKPRSFRIPKDKGLINRMGFNNQGVEYAVSKLKKRDENIIIGGNIGKNTLTPNNKAIDDYIYNFKQLYDFVDYFVVNVSCPNIKDLRELQDKDSLMDILNALIDIRRTKEVRKPILLKVSPDLNDAQLDEVIDIYNETEIDGVVATNTTILRDNLLTDEKRIKEIANGGLSGKPISKRSTEVIRYLNEKSGGKLPIIGVGGIMSVEDALEKIEAGASLVQVYTGFIYEGPAIVKRINKAIYNTIR